MLRRPPRSTLFPYRRSSDLALAVRDLDRTVDFYTRAFGVREYYRDEASAQVLGPGPHDVLAFERSEEHTSELQSRLHLVCRLLLEKKKKQKENSYCTVCDI